MISLSHFVEFERQIKCLANIEEIISITDELAGDIGFLWFNLIRPSASTGRDSSILLTTYPASWVERVFSEGRHLDDPIHAAVLRSVDGVQWKDVGNIIDLNDNQKETLALAGEHGLRNGFTVPFRLSGVPCAMFSVAIPQLSEMEPQLVLAAKLLGGIVFAQAHRIIEEKFGQCEIVRLSPRQIDCIRLIALGLSDYAIGAELGLSPETVREYVEGARQRYSVRRRTQLIGVAIRDGYLTVEEAVGWFRPRLVRSAE